MGTSRMAVQRRPVPTCDGVIELQDIYAHVGQVEASGLRRGRVKAARFRAGKPLKDALNIA